MVRLGQIGNVDHRDHVDGELQQDRKQDVEVQDRRQRSLLGQLLNGLEEGGDQSIGLTSRPSLIKFTLAREIQ